MFFFFIYIYINGGQKAFQIKPDFETERKPITPQQSEPEIDTINYKYSKLKKNVMAQNVNQSSFSRVWLRKGSNKYWYRCWAIVDFKLFNESHNIEGGKQVVSFRNLHLLINTEPQMEYNR